MKSYEGKILQALHGDENTLLISISGNIYVLRGPEIVELTVTQPENRLSEPDLDRILAFSVRNSKSIPQSLTFTLQENVIELLSSSDVATDSLYHHHAKVSAAIWPAPLKGIPCSPGRVSGESFSCKELTAEIQNKIIVCDFLRIRDSHLLKTAKGIILEKGSMLSHVGILAREWNIPCVMGVKGASQIKSGEKILLDADRGIVSRVP